MIRKVLIVDDDPDIREVVRGIVELCDYTACEAADGLAGLAAFTTEQPDLVILDLMMPGLDGNQLRQKIRKLPDGQLVPILMLTAKDGLESKVNSLENGADDYLTKPFHYRELQARLRSLMRIRDLLVNLDSRNRDLAQAQAQLVAFERQRAVEQISGTACHQLGQPLAAALLNCHLLEILPTDDPNYGQALLAVKTETKRAVELLKKIRQSNAERTESYSDHSEILALDID